MLTQIVPFAFRQSIERGIFFILALTIGMAGICSDPSVYAQNYQVELVSTLSGNGQILYVGVEPDPVEGVCGFEIDFKGDFTDSLPGPGTLDLDDSWIVADGTKWESNWQLNSDSSIATLTLWRADSSAADGFGELLRLSGIETVVLDDILKRGSEAIRGIRPKRHPSVTIYPNPNSHWIGIKTSVAIEKIEIWDSYGKKRFEHDNDSKAGPAVVLKHKLAPGVYFARIVFGDQTTTTLRFQVHS